MHDKPYANHITTGNQFHERKSSQNQVAPTLLFLMFKRASRCSIVFGGLTTRHFSHICIPLYPREGNQIVIIEIMQHTVIDVRETDEYHSGHVKGAINVTVDHLLNGTAKVVNLPKDTSIIVYCRTGNRSNIALNILKSLGFTNITNGINQEQVEARFNLR